MNKRRALDQLSPFKDIKEWEAFDEAQAAKEIKDEEPDFIVEESGEVLLDFIELKTQMAAKAA